MLQNNPNRPWKVLLIHHSHTDIGYTDSQSRIARFHVQFLDRVLEIAKKIRGGDPAAAGFRWTSECFWSIEQWLRARPPERHEELIRSIREGVLQLSGTYLHFNELPDAELMRASLGRARDFCRKHGLPLDAAVSADINGSGWGYAQALYDAGIHNLVTCVHAAHGLGPIGRRQSPFFWETPGGQEILVWNGEHYTLGNVLGLCPGAAMNYLFTDEINTPHRVEDTLPLALKRLPRYLRQLELDGYPYDFVPVHVSGAMTDNAPPSEGIIQFVRRWNAAYEGPVRLEMSSPSDLCQRVRAHSESVPRYRGDWPDWWSDGFVSVPSEVRLAREAQRTLRWLQGLGAGPKSGGVGDLFRIEENLLLFSEHTYNHSASIKAPWEIEVKAIGGSKRAYACAAYEAAVDAMDAAFAARGALPNMAPAEAGNRFVYRVLNPLDVPVTDLARVFFDIKDNETMELDSAVVDLASGSSLVCQKTPALRGVTFNVPMTVPARGEVLLELREGTHTVSSARRPCSDVEGAEAETSGPGCIDTPYLTLRLSEEGGIVGLAEKETGLGLLAAHRDHAPFCPVYELTPSAGRDGAAMRKARGFGRNRKGENVQRSAGTLRSLKIGNRGPAWTPVEMDYEVAGTSCFNVHLAVWHSAARIDVTVQIHKNSVWEPENLYLALPFSVPDGELWLDKAGAPLRPWQDQLPDTLTDWFSIQEGFAWCGPSTGLVVATPDSPLLQLGPLAHGKRRLMGHPSLAIRDSRPYAWLMTNYWGTNFDASLGGFHEFRYRIGIGQDLRDPLFALRHCRALNCGLKTFRIAAGNA